MRMNKPRFGQGPRERGPSIGATAPLIWALGTLVAACATETGTGETGPAEEDAAKALQASTTTRYFGMHWQQTFESSWLDELGYCNSMIDDFENVFTQGATKKFGYNLHGKQYYWHNTGDHATNSLEDVDMFVAATHGGAGPTYAEWAMWDFETLATSNNMRLGDEARELSILATYSCHTLQFDADTWTRWDSIFKGGLRFALGSHDDIWYGSAHRYSLQDFALYSLAGVTLKTAWMIGLTTSHDDTDIAIMTAIDSGGDCAARRDNMSWDNFESYSRFRDSSASNWCGYPAGPTRFISMTGIQYSTLQNTPYSRVPNGCSIFEEKENGSDITI